MSVFNRLKQVISVSSVVLLCVTTASMSQATAAERYTVSGVESWDTLNIRSQPSGSSTIIGEIPASGKGVSSNGQESGSGRTTWLKVTWNGVTGWVSKRYLRTDYSSNTPKAVAISQPAYIATPDYSSQGSQRSGDIYDANTGTVRSIYAGPGNGLPAITRKANSGQYVPKPTVNNNAANTHSHPANRCTRSVSHTHPNGANPHTHRYSCQGQATQAPAPVTNNANNANTHTHPRNQFTNAVTHSHASGNVQHKHNYGGQRPAQQRPAQQTQVQAGTASQGQMVTHIHPASPYNKRTQHTHPGGAGVHVHDFLMPKSPAKGTMAQVSTNTHTHPKNQLTNSVTHTHPNGANQHSHSYGQR